ncbi:MAG TPA: protein kinase, partial [Terriglobales bacterium]
LQHPNICTLHDIGQQDGLDYLVLEFVEGETLDARLTKGPLPVDQVLRYAGEIADALDKAHRLGIVHRDLKPANIMLTRSGAKLLDFGLAHLEPRSTALSPSATDVTLATQRLTAEGTLVGTFQYMSPEQLEGKEADHRSDIFALGAVIYEMATGKAAFAGTSRASLIAAIMTLEPAPVSSLQPMTPRALDRVVKRCLAKDADDRWQSAGDLASELKWIAEGGSQAGIPEPGVSVRRRKDWRPWAIAAGALALAMAGWLARFAASGKSPSSIHAFLPAPQNTAYFFGGDSGGPPVISPRGDLVAFVAADSHAVRQIWIRSLADGSAHALAGTESAYFPFWSPDGKWIGYFAQSKLKKISVNGSVPVDIADASGGRGGAWNSDDIIVFSPITQDALYSVPASGGSPRPVTKLDTSRHSTHRWPYFLPDGKHFLYLASSHLKPHAEFDAIYVASLDGKDNRLLTPSTSNAIAVPGYLLYIQGSTLMARPFDEASATLRGEPVPVTQNVRFEEGNWRGVFDCSADGTLVYQSAISSEGTQLTWYAHDGRVLGKLGDPDVYNNVRLSPNGKQLAVSIGDPNANIWVYEVNTGARIRYTYGGITDRSPVWSPDGKQLVFYRVQPPGSIIEVVTAGSAGADKQFFSSQSMKWPTSWSPDGKYLMFTESPVGQGISIVPTSGDKKVQEFLPKRLDANYGGSHPTDIG